MWPRLGEREGKAAWVRGGRGGEGRESTTGWAELGEARGVGLGLVGKRGREDLELCV